MVDRILSLASLFTHLSIVWSVIGLMQEETVLRRVDMDKRLPEGTEKLSSPLNPIIRVCMKNDILSKLMEGGP